MALLIDQVSLLNFGGSGNYSRDRYEDNDVSISSSNEWNQSRRGHRSHGSGPKSKARGQGPQGLLSPPVAPFPPTTPRR